MRVVDELLEDDELLDTVYEAQGQRHARSRTRGRTQTPAKVALRMLILKHVRNWSYEVLEREVRANVVYRSFCRIGMEKVPDEKTLVRLGQTIGPETIRALHDRVVALARQRGVIRGRKMRVDTTVVETNIHYPTDSGLLNDGARTLTRTMKRIEGKTGGLKKKVRNRMRSVTRRVIAIGHALRHKGVEGELKRKREYRQLVRLTQQILNDSRRVSEEVAHLPPRRRRQVEGLCERLQSMSDRVRQVVRQTRARVLAVSPSCRESWSVCSSRTRKSFAKARRESPTNSANWCRFRKRRIRLLPTTRCMTKGRAISICCFRQWKPISARSAGRLD
jgi:IS5 family transposase